MVTDLLLQCRIIDDYNVVGVVPEAVDGSQCLGVALFKLVLGQGAVGCCMTLEQGCSWRRGKLSDCKPGF